ncbi:hypothetical protein CGC49_06340 [Capnocytophaga sp. H4358]|uniref:hypothetical protein n=1 Tax=Capnocytophaga TaxID=1016 RepID=UPI000BB1E797|nr:MULTISPECIES: hypothetical protein [unclassified Capnocytophaga]ATA72928.1 hypothetical protein CGC49_06340 [Capnocytophaga sp. H4358]ATA75018.1 hypothetical protein CGC52_06055 [Capnocytophaga sp. H2931]
MKGKDKQKLIIIIITSILLGYFVIPFSFDGYSDIITFLSIMIGFKITSFSLVFNSKLKKLLYDRKIKNYETELHRIMYLYKASIYFEVISVIIIFIIPEFYYEMNIRSFRLEFGKNLVVLPILLGSLFCFKVLFDDLLKIFTYPTNE